ncbi:WD domain-containing protein [Mollisia scopiformis]|uniref:WD domain-containing protein n=1 Tax=Mollisia scopiformis TaxID=149040 RepID=A0A194WW14_MOLSC|nr:WD domain-containing protein [Mollisia scopiformis]KUJ12153.1 WD domain-containing protein [Mollisia scopiformis]
MDPLSAIASAIAIIQAISSTYKVIEDLKNLPKAFREVNKSLPIVEDTLKIARQQLLGKSVDESTKKAIEPYIIASEEKAKSLRDIFKKVEQGQVQGKDTKGWSVVDFYRTTVVPMGKAHRVESLMKDILEAVKNLATYQVFKTATQQQVKKLEDAINELAKVEPSLPDSDFEAKSTTNVSQSVAEGGKGNQAVNSGPGQQDNNFGNKFESGGGAFNFGEGVLKLLGGN